MSEAEILAELPRLNLEARTHVFRRLCELQEQDILEGAGPSAEEKRILDEALAEFRRDGDVGVPWRDAIQRLRTSPHP